MNSEEQDLVIQSVLSGVRYKEIHPGLVQRLAGEELTKGRSVKAAAKAVRNKLHQVGGAYQQESISYRLAMLEMEQIPVNLDDPELQDYCRSLLGRHTSTRERLPILQNFFHTTLAAISPVQSILDLACGLNVLSLPWIPIAPGAAYYGCDIYSDMVFFANRFLDHVQVPGEVNLCDLTQSIPSYNAQVAFVLKTIPCLEQLDKHITQTLLDKIPCENILVSFPSHSLGGRSKGMVAHYGERFEHILSEYSWQVQRFEFVGELAYLIRR